MDRPNLASQPAPSNRSRILALDYGAKRIGLAFSDELGLTAQPAGALERTNRREDMGRLRAMAREHGVERIVIGLPLRLDGRQSAMAEQVRRFGARLRKHLGLPVEFVDERLTSWEAAGHERRRTTAPRQRGSRDALAAAIILRDYLARRPSRGDSAAHPPAQTPSAAKEKAGIS
jgi:putative holliday junction resolvase